MASYGFEAINSNGSVQVTERFSNYRVYQTGSVAVDSLTAAVTITLNPVRNKVPLLAIAPGVDMRVGPVELRTNSSGQYTHLVFRKRTATGNGGTIYYAILDEETISSLANTESHGLQVFNADGSVAFDSRERYMHVVDVVLAKFEGLDTVYTYAQPSLTRAYYLMSAIVGQVGNFYPGTGEYDTYEPLVRQASATSFETVMAYVGTDIVTTHGNGIPSPQPVIICSISD